MKHYFDSLILLVNQRDILLNLDAWKLATIIFKDSSLIDIKYYDLAYNLTL